MSVDFQIYISVPLKVINIFRFKKRTHAEYDTNSTEVKILDKRGWIFIDLCKFC